MHLEWSRRAAERGKHVLCEKPLGLNAAECIEMDAVAQVNGVVLMEGFMYRFHPRIDRVIRIVRDGGIGKLEAIRSAFTFRLMRNDNIRWSAELGGGALMDVGCYCVNVSRTITGEEPVEAIAWAEWSDTGVDAKLSAMLRFGNGVVAQFDCGMTMERRELVEVAGTDGYLSLESAFLPGKGDVDVHIRRGRDDMTAETIPGVDEYTRMVEHFADCALNGTAPRYPVADAAANMRAIEALYASARAGGMPVEVASG
jgi:predicted dehydrogenase